MLNCKEKIMNCKPESSILLDSLVSQLKDILLTSTLSDGSSIFDFLGRFDIQDGLKISINISVPEKIEKARSLISENQLQFATGNCWYWDEDIGAFVSEPCR
jgi:hypothetical protein